MKTERSFFIAHSHGGNVVEATTAAEALRKTFIPLGFKDVVAVIDYSIIAMVNMRGIKGPFRAFIGTPVKEAP